MIQKILYFRKFKISLLMNLLVKLTFQKIEDVIIVGLKLFHIELDTVNNVMHVSINLIIIASG